MLRSGSLCARAPSLRRRGALFAVAVGVALATPLAPIRPAEAALPAGTAAGGLFPVRPTRVVDTRPSPFRVGSFATLPAQGVIEVSLTGVAGIPEHGVSAVLLNVTAIAPTTEGWIGVYPRLPQAQLFFDQSWFRTTPPTSNLNFATGDVLPNLVLARVGAGGIIRLENLQGNVHVIADVVGWFG